MDGNGRVTRNPAASPVPCPDGEVWFVAGQSQAAGAAERPPAMPSGVVVQYHAGRCWDLALPVLGASSLPADEPHFNPFVHAAMGYSERTGRAVIVRFFAVGGQSVRRWSEGDLGGLMAEEMADLSRLGPVDRFMWQQGETDALSGMTSHEYAAHLGAVLDLIRSTGFSGRIHVARSSRCYDLDRDNEVGRAQEIFEGPDTDVLGPEYRHDKCHFNGAGVLAFSRAWVSHLTEGM